MTMIMTVTVNGEAVAVAPGTSVAALVARRAEGKRRVAVAINGDVVPRSEWDATTLGHDDAVEILAAVAGG